MARLRHHGGQFVAVFVATRLNLPDLWDTIRLAYAFGARGMILNPGRYHSIPTPGVWVLRSWLQPGLLHPGPDRQPASLQPHHDRFRQPVRGAF
jgi:hypothetical protein